MGISTKSIKVLIITLFIGASQFSTGQILNAEALRKVTDTSGFSGSASVDFALKRNNNDFFVLGSDIHIQYKMNKHLVLFKNDIDFLKIEEEDFSNSGITHFRHNYRFHPRIAWETFIQGQYNKVSKIDFRALLGMGPRFKLSGSENYKFYAGTLIMFEYEELTDGVTPLQRNLRGSTYLSFSLYPTERITVVSTTYFQPLLKNFEDHRISSQSSLVIELFKDFAFKTTYTFVFDKFPAIGIQRSQYDFTSGIAYTFD